MEYEPYHHRIRENGVHLLAYLIVRAFFQPFFHVYFRMRRIGREYLPSSGPVIVAANHRSFLDPFVIGTMARRPMYYMAKTGLLPPLAGLDPERAWRLPRGPGSSDEEAMKTAKAILDRGGVVLIFPEGTRIRPGAGHAPPARGRLALQTGAPVVPVSVIGTEAVRRGWRIRPHKVVIRAGRPLRFPVVPEPSKELAGAVTERIWPCVMLQWEWLGGLPPIRRAAIIGAGTWGTSLAVSLARAGVEVDLGCRTNEQAEAVQAAAGQRGLPPERRASGLRPGPACRRPGPGGRRSRVPGRSCPGPARGVGRPWRTHPAGRRAARPVQRLVPPLGTLPSAFASERCAARSVAVLGGPAHAAEAIQGGASVVLGRPTAPCASSWPTSCAAPAWTFRSALM